LSVTDSSSRVNPLKLRISGARQLGICMPLAAGVAKHSLPNACHLMQ